MSKTQSADYTKIIILCMVCALANAAFSHLVTNVLKLPLYADTIFTVAMCFTAGMFFGILTGAVFSPLVFFFVCIYVLKLPVETALTRNVFIICIVVEALLVCKFYPRIKVHEAAFFKNLANKHEVYYSFLLFGVHLLVLVVLDCVIISIIGGLVYSVVFELSASLTVSPEDTFTLAMLRSNIPLVFAAIISRIPINLADRFIVIFGGYGFSLVFRKWVGARL